jgi:hypothetical protein
MNLPELSEATILRQADEEDNMNISAGKRQLEAVRSQLVDVSRAIASTTPQKALRTFAPVRGHEERRQKVS